MSLLQKGYHEPDPVLLPALNNLLLDLMRRVGIATTLNTAELQEFVIRVQAYERVCGNVMGSRPLTSDMLCEAINLQSECKPTTREEFKMTLGEHLLRQLGVTL